jgi:glyoxylase-like metal-dependent hydrolase (beta-lactamase superfamily II)
MSTSEILPGVYVTKGKFADEFGFIASYIVVDGGEAAVIDPGTAGDPGEITLDALRRFGIDPKKEIVAILCTHGHPDHVGGANRLKKLTGAPIMIHEADARLLEAPESFITERLLLDPAGRFAMKLERGPLRVNYKGIKPDSLLTHGQEVRVGGVNLRVIHTGGHSAGHVVFLDPARKILFSGDEVNNLPNDPRKFYVDLSGSFAAKLSALDRLSSIGLEYLLPAHDIVHIVDDIELQFDEARDSVIQFQDTIMTIVRERGETDVGQIQFDVTQARSMSYPTSLRALLPTTIQAALLNLENAGLVRKAGRKAWKAV